jgi:hypothetical protein
MAGQFRPTHASVDGQYIEKLNIQRIYGEITCEIATFIRV